MPTITRLTATLALAFATGACSTAVMPGADPFAPEGTITVQVSNNNWSDMNVYAVRMGMRYRLGTVTSMTTRRLEIPAAVAGAGFNLRLLVDPIGGTKTYKTALIHAGPGERIEFTVENYLPISSFSVWAR